MTLSASKKLLQKNFRRKKRSQGREGKIGIVSEPHFCVEPTANSRESDEAEMSKYQTANAVLTTKWNSEWRSMISESSVVGSILQHIRQSHSVAATFWLKFLAKSATIICYHQPVRRLQHYLYRILTKNKIWDSIWSIFCQIQFMRLPEVVRNSLPTFDENSDEFATINPFSFRRTIS